MVKEIVIIEVIKIAKPINFVSIVIKILKISLVENDQFVSTKIL